MELNYGATDLLAIMPMLLLTIGAVVSIGFDLFKIRFPRLAWNVSVCLMAMYVAFSFSAMSPLAAQQLDGRLLLVNGLIYADNFSSVISCLLIGGLLFSFLLNHGQLAKQRLNDSVDVDGMLMLATVGGLVMISAADLIVFFLGFEILSMCVYTLSGLARREKSSSEAALKYFVLGAFSSAFLLYGIALIYGATGTMNLTSIAQSFDPNSYMGWVGFALLLFGFGFKIGLVPFHYWTPDVYQGAPISITAYMAVVVKAAAITAFLRIMALAFAPSIEAWAPIFWALSVLTMTVGNLLALRQKSVKRMLAYSSIAHAGYMLMGFVVMGQPNAGGAVVFYVLVYALMTVASFGVALIVSIASDRQYAGDDGSDFAGLGWTSPILGLCMGAALLSLAGMPPFAGFFGKLYLFTAAINGGYVWLAVIAAVNSVVSLYYYLALIVRMYFTPTLQELPITMHAFRAPMWAVGMAAASLVGIGIFAEQVMQLARYAVASF